jgi:hypothetical protein
LWLSCCTRRRLCFCFLVIPRARNNSSAFDIGWGDSGKLGASGWRLGRAVSGEGTGRPMLSLCSETRAREVKGAISGTGSDGILDNEHGADASVSGGYASLYLFGLLILFIWFLSRFSGPFYIFCFFVLSVSMVPIVQNGIG